MAVMGGCVHALTCGYVFGRVISACSCVIGASSRVICAHVTYLLVGSCVFKRMQAESLRPWWWWAGWLWLLVVSVSLDCWALGTLLRGCQRMLGVTPSDCLLCLREHRCGNCLRVGVVLCVLAGLAGTAIGDVFTPGLYCAVFASHVSDTAAECLETPLDRRVLPHVRAVQVHRVDLVKFSLIRFKVDRLLMPVVRRFGRQLS